MTKISAREATDVAIDDRSPVDVALDTAASAVRGVLLSCEAEFDGQMAMTLQVLARAINEFLDDVEMHAGADVADAYAKVLVEEIKGR